MLCKLEYSEVHMLCKLEYSEIHMLCKLKTYELGFTCHTGSTNLMYCIAYCPKHSLHCAQRKDGAVQKLCCCSQHLKLYCTVRLGGQINYLES